MLHLWYKTCWIPIEFYILKDIAEKRYQVKKKLTNGDTIL